MSVVGAPETESESAAPGAIGEVPLRPDEEEVDEPFSGISGPTAGSMEQPLVIDQVCGSTWRALRDMWVARELLYMIIFRDLASRYRQTVLGIAWVVLTPLLSMMVYTLFFGFMNRMGPEGVPYPVFLFPALVIWGYFSSSLGRASNALVSQVSLLRKVYFPRFALPFAGVLSPVIDMLCTMVVLAGLLGLYTVLDNGFEFVFTARLLLLPAFFLLAFGTALGMGSWLAGLNAHYRDVQVILPVVTHLWFFCTPILYEMTEISNRLGETGLAEFWMTVWAINPMVTAVQGFRWAIIDQPPPTWEMIGVSTTVVVGFVFLGLTMFNRLEKRITDVL